MFSFFAFSALETASIEISDRQNVAFYSIARTVILGVVGSAILDKTIESTESSPLFLSAP